ncbi:transposase [Streptomyces sp. NPDC005529]|uniref:transposase n=1 Tax=unclassified Streptomyces TaxID=2593676 RepID=UPI00339FDA49
MDSFDLTGTAVTADAHHTQREHAKWLVEAKSAHYLLVINQPRLHAAVRALPWKEVTARRYDREAGHGRRETRSICTLTVTDLSLDFPHIVQAVKILRHRTDLKTDETTRQTIHAITDMTEQEASPQLIGHMARAQWGIEAIHHIRNTTFAEDASKIAPDTDPSFSGMVPIESRQPHRRFQFPGGHGGCFIGAARRIRRPGERGPDGHHGGACAPGSRCGSSVRRRRWSA